MSVLEPKRGAARLTEDHLDCGRVPAELNELLYGRDFVNGAVYGLLQDRLGVEVGSVDEALDRRGARIITHTVEEAKRNS